MTELVLLDNDVVVKACAYGCHLEVVELGTLMDGPPLLLTVASYAIRTRIARGNTIGDKASALAAYEEMVATLTKVDPTDEELAIAAELEEIANQRGLDLDVGESQLIAILLQRNLALVFTGDKRAVRAIATLKPVEVGQRILCLEQLLTGLLEIIHHDELRKRVCAEPNADKAVTNCFGCSASEVSLENVLAGLGSYVSSLAKAASTVMAPTETLYR